MALHEVGNVQLGAGKFDDALSSFKQELDALNQSSTNPTKERQKELFENKLSVGRVYAALEKHSEALEQFEEVLKSKPITQPLLSSVQCAIAKSRYALGDESAATDAAKEAVKIQKAYKTDDLKKQINHEELGTLYQILGAVYFDQGKYDSALESFQESVNARRRLYTSNLHVNLAESLFSLGLAYCTMRNNSRAVVALDEAFNIRKSLLPVDHVDVKTASEFSDAVRQRLQQFFT